MKIKKISHIFKYYLLLNSIWVGLACCQGPRIDNGNWANREIFWYQVQDEINSEISKQILEFIRIETSTKQFALLKNSRLDNWPYYTILNPEEEIPLDSILEPHKTIHVLEYHTPTSRPEEGEYMVRAIFRRKPDNYTLKLQKLRWSNSEWIQIVDLDEVPLHCPAVENTATSVLEKIVITSWK